MNYFIADNPNKIRILTLYELKTERFQRLAEHLLERGVQRHGIRLCGFLEVKCRNIAAPFFRNILEISADVRRLNFQSQLFQCILNKNCIFCHCFGKLLPCPTLCQKRLPELLRSSHRFFYAVPRTVPDNDLIIAAALIGKLQKCKVAVDYLY